MRTLRRITPLVAAVALILGVSATATTEPPITYVPPQSAITPDGAKPAAPPVSLTPGAVITLHVDTNGLHLVEGFEGFSERPYWDPLGKVWTRGYGETEGITSKSPPISRAQGQEKLRELIETRYMWAIRDLRVPLNQNQVDALVSFVWNLGAGIFIGTTVGNDLRDRAYFAATRVMLEYDHAGGSVVFGLRVRREAEVRLFLTPVAKPKPPNYKSELSADYRLRAELRVLLTQNRCRTAKPRRGYSHACHIWLKQGSEVNRSITKLHARGIF